MANAIAPTKQILMSDMLTADNAVGVRRLKVDDGSTSYDEGREFRAFYKVMASDLPTVLRFESATDIDLTLSTQDVTDGAMRYRVFAGGVEGGSFDTVIPSLRVNNKSSAPVMDSGLTITTGGTLDTATATQLDLVEVLATSSGSNRETVSDSQERMRGFSAGVVYVVIDKIPAESKAPNGVVKYEWTVN